MNTLDKFDDLTQFEEEKLCNLLECNNDELTKLYKNAGIVVKKTDTLYNTLLTILQQGNNVREAALMGILCGKLIGFSEAKNKIECDIKDKLFDAFKNNGTL